MNQVPIKASAITNLTDARYFAARGADWLTFDLDPAMELSLSTTEFHAIREWVEGPKIVGNFGLLEASKIVSIYDECRLDAIQVHPFMPLHQLEILEGKTIIQSYTVDNLSDLAPRLNTFIEERSSFVNYFMLDFSTNEFPWDEVTKHQNLVTLLVELCKSHAIFFSLPFNNNNPHTFLETVSPFGIDVSGSEEEKIGFKSFDELDELLDHVEILE